MEAPGIPYWWCLILEQHTELKEVLCLHLPIPYKWIPNDDSQPSVTSVPGPLMPFCDLWRQRLCTWFTVRNAGKSYMLQTSKQSYSKWRKTRNVICSQECNFYGGEGDTPHFCAGRALSIHFYAVGGLSPSTSMQWREYSPSTSMRWGEHSPSTSKWHSTKKREIKGIQAEKEEVKFPLFADNMICTWDPKDPKDSIWTQIEEILPTKSLDIKLTSRV